MAEKCFNKKDSKPPVCGVHNVPLTESQIPAELIASGHKSYTFFLCPVSGQVVNEDETR